MSSIPKPLKFMSPLYEKLKEKFASYAMVDNFKVSYFYINIFQKELSDLCSVIGMVAAPEETTECLDFCLTGTMKNLKDWGHEYLRSLSG